MLYEFILLHFHSEIALYMSFGLLGKLSYIFYAFAGILIFRPHYNQMLKLKHGIKGAGDTCLRSQIESIVLRFAALFFAITINSKLMLLATLIDITGRLLVLIESKKANVRFDAYYFSESKSDMTDAMDKPLKLN